MRKMWFVFLCSMVLGCGGDDGAGDSCEPDECTACVDDKCTTELQACYGAGFGGGSFSGDCAMLGQCTVDNDCCGDNAGQECATTCGPFLDQMCLDCIDVLDACEDAQCASECSGGGNAMGACGDLETCCDSLDPGNVGACYQVVAADNAQACTDTLGSYQMGGLCQ
jgi:hypothetical protein